MNWMDLRRRGLSAVVLGLGLVLTLAPAAWAQQRGARANRPAGDIPGPIDSVRDLRDTGKLLFKLVDADNDGRISQREAIDAGNLVVGGYFFRADADGDGKLTKQEAQQAREALMQQRPWLRYVLSKGDQQQQAEDEPTSKDAVRGIGELLDRDDDKAIEAAEVRKAVQSTVESVFAVVDTDQDGSLAPAELNTAIASAVRTVGQTLFQTADKDENGTLSQDEFLKSLAEPARTVFAVLDANDDKELSPEEIQKAERVIISQLRALRVPGPGTRDQSVIRSEGAVLQPAAAAPRPIRPTTPAPGQGR